MIKWGPRVAALAAVLLAFAYFIIRARYYASWMDDDAFISYRYARNLVRGAGLVYNVGERVEGYSNFLWTLLLAGAHRLGAPLPEIGRALGIAFAVATGILLLAFRMLPKGNPGAGALLVVLPTVALWLTDSWAAWAVGGLENPLGAFLVASTFLLYFRSLDSRNPLPAAALAGLVATLAVLAHPSYAVFGLLLGAHSIATAIRSRAWHRPIALAVPALIVGVPYLAWKIGYYGHVLPNTFRAKVGLTPAVLARGLRYLGEAVVGLPIVGIVPIAVGIWLLARRDGDHRPWLLLGGLGLYAAYAIGIGGDEFPAFRLFVVVLPLACLLMQYAVASVSTSRIGPAVTLGLALATTLGLSAFNRVSPRVRVLDAAISIDALGCFRAVGLELKRRLPPNGLVAHSGAGVIAFYSELPFLDTMGLTNEQIASRTISNMGESGAGHEKGDGRYVFSRRPHVIIIGGSPVSTFTPVLLGDRELLSIPEFPEVYDPLVMEVRFTRRGSHEEAMVRVPVFVRKDLIPR
jgi:hypothetical protein